MSFFLRVYFNKVLLSIHVYWYLTFFYILRSQISFEKWTWLYAELSEKFLIAHLLILILILNDLLILFLVLIPLIWNLIKLLNCAFMLFRSYLCVYYFLNIRPNILLILFDFSNLILDYLSLTKFSLFLKKTKFIFKLITQICFLPRPFFATLIYE